MIDLTISLEYRLSTQVDALIAHITSVVESNIRKSVPLIAEVLNERNGVTGIEVVLIACSITNTNISSFISGQNIDSTNIARKLAWWYLSDALNVTHDDIAYFSKKERSTVTTAILTTKKWVEVGDKKYLDARTEFLSRIELLKSKKITKVNIESHDYATES